MPTVLQSRPFCDKSNEFLGLEPLTNLIHRQRTLALAETATVWSDEKREVGIRWHLIAQEAEQETLLMRSRHEITSPDDLCHTHEGIVNNDSQLICEIAITTTQNEIATICGEDGTLLTIVSISEDADLIGESQTPSGFTRLTQNGLFEFREIETSAGVDGVTV